MYNFQTLYVIITGFTVRFTLNYIIRKVNNEKATDNLWHVYYLLGVLGWFIVFICLDDFCYKRMPNHVSLI